MFETDYIVRMIHQFVAFLARLLFRIQSGNLNEARLDIRNASEQFLGLSLALILGLSNEGLSDILSLDGGRDVEKVYVAAQLIFCEARVRDADGQPDATELYLKSLDLLLRHFPRMDETLKDGAISAIDQIVTSLGNQDLSLETCRLLVAYYEIRGEYARSEDRLFELTERGLGEALQIGVSFYERLLKKTDQELERGNLPRNEVTEGLEELKARCYAQQTSK